VIPVSKHEEQLLKSVLLSQSEVHFYHTAIKHPV